MYCFRIPPLLRSAAIGSLLCLLTGSALADKRLNNGQLESWENDHPAGWALPDTQKILSTAGAEGQGQALKVEVTTAIPGKDGEIRQAFDIEPRSRYRISGQIQGPAGMGAIELILYRKGEPYTRVRSKPVLSSDWTTVGFNFETADCDSAEAVLSWTQETDQLGQTVAFDNLAITELGPLVYEGEEVSPQAIATFNSVGLYWKPTGGSAARKVSVHYRKVGEDSWSLRAPSVRWRSQRLHRGPLVGS